jgi:hypothetical protein
MHTVAVLKRVLQIKKVLMLNGSEFIIFYNIKGRVKQTTNLEEGSLLI